MSRSSVSSSSHARSATASQASELLRPLRAAIAKEEAALREGGGGRLATNVSERMNRLPVRERLGGLLDKDSPFFEIGLWAAYKVLSRARWFGDCDVAQDQMRRRVCVSSVD